MKSWKCAGSTTVNTLGIWSNLGGFSSMKIRNPSVMLACSEGRTLAGQQWPFRVERASEREGTHTHAYTGNPLPQKELFDRQPSFQWVLMGHAWPALGLEPLVVAGRRRVEGNHEVKQQGVCRYFRGCSLL